MSIEEKFDFSKFIQRIYINKGSEQVYKMWATAENIKRWYVKNSVCHTPAGVLRNNSEEIHAGDEYDWKWTDSARLNGLILEADGFSNFKFTFGTDVTVSVNMKQTGSRTLVELTQIHESGDAESKLNNYLACFPGWEFYLINLKSVCEGGLDLRESNPDVELLVNI